MRKISVYGLGKVDVEGKHPYSGSVRPTETSRISVTLSDLECTCELNVLDSHYMMCKDEGITFGEATSLFDRALEIAFCIMVDGEIADVCINIPKRYLCNSFSDDVNVQCKAHLQIVELGKHVYEFTVEEKLALARRYKNVGVDLYKEGSVPKQMSAYLFFAQAVKWLSTIGPNEAEDSQSEVKNLKMQCYNNISLYHLHQKNFPLTLSAASNVLQLDNKNVKALYRRAVANTELQNYEVAEQDVKVALMMDPNNGPVKKQQEELKKRQKAVTEKYAEAMKKFFR